ncbi:MAG TPA: nuclear transport factor 2 family protein [Solirubrobacterales bacterium]|nr:nuclear transport factor 2 family protein [Solirubrobacterales bacterium]
MSEENVEIVVGCFEAVNRGEFAAVVDAYAEDVTLEIHADMAVENHAAGKTAVVAWFSDWFRQFARGYRFELDDVRDAGDDRVYVLATHHGRGRASGAPVTRQMAYVYTVRNGRVARMEVWGEPEPALVAAGLTSGS